MVYFIGGQIEMWNIFEHLAKIIQYSGFKVLKKNYNLFEIKVTNLQGQDADIFVAVV